MRFGEAHWLLLLWVVPVLAFLLIWAFRRRDRDLARWCQPGLWSRMIPARNTWASYWKGGLLLLAVLFLVLTAARPQIGSRILTVKRKGIDVIVALDTSESMLAEDLKPNRITRARQEIQALIDRLRGDRIGLVAFSGDAFVQCPVTMDYAAARMFLRYMDTNLVPVPGTSIARAIEVATGAFDQKENKFKALVLITDGEDHEGKVMDAARAAKEKGVRIFAVGIGTEQGEPIPIRDAQGNIRDYKRDAKGEVILSRCDAGTLQEICRVTGGSYHDGSSGSMALDQLYGEIDKMEQREMEGGIVTQYEDRYGYFAAVALFLLALEWLIGTKRRFPRPRRAAEKAGPAGSPPAGGRPGLDDAAAFARAGRRIGLGIGLLLALGAGTARADSGARAYAKGKYDAARDAYEAYTVKHPEDPRGEYDLGTALHRTGEMEPAENALRRAVSVEDPTLRAKAFYNLGNTQVRKGDLKSALESYKMALRYDPDDEDTKVNLELVDRLLQSTPPDSSGQQQNSQQQKKSDSDKKKQQDQQKQDQQKQDQQKQDQQKQDQQKQDQHKQEQQQQDQQKQDRQGQQNQQDQKQQQGQDQQQNQESASKSDSTKAEQQAGAASEKNGAEGDSSQAAMQQLKVSPEQARRILDALAQQEMLLQAERMKARSSNVKVEKDW